MSDAALYHVIRWSVENPEARPSVTQNIEIL
jgi:hypothetical protein